MNKRCSFLLTILLLLSLKPEIQATSAQYSTPVESAKDGKGTLDRKLLAQLVAEETNRFRVSRGREALSICEPLMAAAQIHARAMASEDFFAHENPHDAGQKTLTDRIRNAGLDPKAYAENIALTYSINFANPAGSLRSGDKAPAALEYTYRALARSVVNQWINSRGHRKNMLSKPFSQLGLGFATAKDGHGLEKIYCVQTFCAPI